MARKGVEAVTCLALGRKSVRVQQGREPGAEVRTQLEAGVGAGAVTGFTQCCTYSMCGRAYFRRCARSAPGAGLRAWTQEYLYPQVQYRTWQPQRSEREKARENPNLSFSYQVAERVRGFLDGARNHNKRHSTKPATNRHRTAPISLKIPPISPNRYQLPAVVTLDLYRGAPW